MSELANYTKQKYLAEKELDERKKRSQKVSLVLIRQKTKPACYKSGNFCEILGHTKRRKFIYHLGFDHVSNPILSKYLQTPFSTNTTFK